MMRSAEEVASDETLFPCVRAGVRDACFRSAAAGNSLPLRSGFSATPARPRSWRSHGRCGEFAGPHLCVLPGQHHRRSEEHTFELQSHSDLVCRLLLEKKKKK